MNTVPLDPSLLISLSIFIGLFLSTLFNLSDKVTDNGNLNINIILPLLWKVGFASIFLMFLIVYIDKDIAKALSPVLLVLSAFIASASVMKSIEETKKLEAEKKERLKQRNLSILKVELQNLVKEIDNQILFLEDTNILEMNKYKYSEKQLDRRLYRLSELLTGLDINEYNTDDLIKSLIKVKNIIYDRIDEFGIIFDLVEEVQKISYYSLIVKIIEEYGNNPSKDVIETEVRANNIFDTVVVTAEEVEKIFARIELIKEQIEELKQKLNTNKGLTEELINTL